MDLIEVLVFLPAILALVIVLFVPMRTIVGLSGSIVVGGLLLGLQLAVMMAFAAFAGGGASFPAEVFGGAVLVYATICFAKYLRATNVADGSSDQLEHRDLTAPQLSMSQGRTADPEPRDVSVEAGSVSSVDVEPVSGPHEPIPLPDDGRLLVASLLILSLAVAAGMIGGLSGSYPPTEGFVGTCAAIAVLTVLWWLDYSVQQRRWVRGLVGMEAPYTHVQRLRAFWVKAWWWSLGACVACVGIMIERLSAPVSGVREDPTGLAGVVGVFATSYLPVGWGVAVLSGAMVLAYTPRTASVSR